MCSNDDVSRARRARQLREFLMIPKTMKSYLSIGPVVLAVLLVYGLGEKDAPRAIRVPEDQGTLAAAIAAASAGDTIVLSAGRFAGTRPGVWPRVTSSADPDLDGKRGKSPSKSTARRDSRGCT